MLLRDARVTLNLKNSLFSRRHQLFRSRNPFRTTASIYGDDGTGLQVENPQSIDRNEIFLRLWQCIPELRSELPKKGSNVD